MSPFLGWVQSPQCTGIHRGTIKTQKQPCCFWSHFPSNSFRESEELPSIGKTEVNVCLLIVSFSTVCSPLCTQTCSQIKMEWIFNGLKWIWDDDCFLLWHRGSWMCPGNAPTLRGQAQSGRAGPRRSVVTLSAYLGRRLPRSEINPALTDNKSSPLALNSEVRSPSTWINCEKTSSEGNPPTVTWAAKRPQNATTLLRMTIIIILWWSMV